MSLTSTAGSILDSSSAITASDLSLTADGATQAIGASGASNDINTTLSGTLTASAGTGAGGIYITESDAMSVGSIDAGTGDIELESGGTITDTGTDNTAVDITGAELTIRDATGVGTSAADALNLNVTNLTVTTASGAGFITENDALGLGTVNFNGNNLTLVATGDLTDNSSSVTANVLTLQADGNAGIGTAVTSITVDATTLHTDTTAGNTSTGSDQFINESSSVALGTLNAAGGNITLTAAADITNSSSRVCSR